MLGLTAGIQVGVPSVQLGVGGGGSGTQQAPAVHHAHQTHQAPGQATMPPAPGQLPKQHAPDAKGGGPMAAPAQASQGAQALGGGDAGSLAAVLTSLVEVLKSLVQALSSSVGGAIGGGPGQKPPGDLPPLDKDCPPPTGGGAKPPMAPGGAPAPGAPPAAPGGAGAPPAPGAGAGLPPALPAAPAA